jgi:hypothetical protein
MDALQGQQRTISWRPSHLTHASPQSIRRLATPELTASLLVKHTATLTCEDADEPPVVLAGPVAEPYPSQ